jgi:hypothetical protein
VEGRLFYFENGSWIESFGAMPCLLGSFCTILRYSNDRNG